MSSFDEYENSDRVQIGSGFYPEPALTDKPDGPCYKEKLPPPTCNPQPTPTEPVKDEAATNWPLLIGVIIIIILLLYIAFRTPPAVGSVSVDFSPVESMFAPVTSLLREMREDIKFIKDQRMPKVIQPINQDVAVLKKRIASLEKDNSWLKHLLRKEKEKRRRNVSVKSAKQVEIEEHYKMRKHAISELFRAPWRQGEGSRTLCFSTNMQEPVCYYKDRYENEVKLHKN